jgi:hypothetical protein
VSHPIPLHTADKLERAMDACLQRAVARGAKGWVMRIVAYFACQYAGAVIELLEGLLAEYRAGTLILPGRPYDPSTVSEGYETERHRAAASRRPAARRSRASRATRANNPCANNPCANNPCANNSCDDPADAAEPSAAVAPRRRALVLASSPLPMRRPGPAPRGLCGHPSVVPRAPAQKLSASSIAHMHAHFVTM